MARHIGIVACSAEGAALCYLTISTEAAARMGRHNHPEVSMHTHPLARYMASIERGDWQAVADLMLDSARRLAAIGAEFLISPDNTIHQTMPLVAPRSPLPWLHIADETIAAARAGGYRRLAVLGCTEIPLLVDPAAAPLPVLDSTRLPARAALREAMGGTASVPNLG